MQTHGSGKTHRAATLSGAMQSWLKMAQGPCPTCVTQFPQLDVRKKKKKHTEQTQKHDPVDPRQADILGNPFAIFLLVFKSWQALGDLQSQIKARTKLEVLVELGCTQINGYIICGGLNLLGEVACFGPFGSNAKSKTDLV